MKLNWHFLNNPDLRPALIKISNSSKIPAKPAYRLGKFCMEIEQELNRLKEFGKNVITECCELTEDGNPKVENGNYVFKSKTLSDMHAKQYDEAMKTEFEVSFAKVPFSHLKEVGLTPKELLAIEPILDTDSQEASSLISLAN